MTKEILENLKQQIKSHNDAATALRDKYADAPQDMPQETLQDIQGHIGKVQELRAQVDIQEQLADNKDYLAQSAGVKASHHGFMPEAPGGGDVPVDGKSWREYTYKTLVSHPQLGLIPEEKSIRFNVPLAVEHKDYPDLFEAYLRKGRNSLSTKDQKTLTEGIDNAGGFLVPPDYHVELIKKVATMATVRPNARVVQTSRDVAQWPKVIYNDNDEYTSGVRLTWSGSENPATTSHRVTDPVFGMHNIPVNTAMASMPVSLNLLEDSAFDVMGLGAELFAEAFALGENDAFWNGSGVARPTGILTAANTTTDAADHIINITAATANVVNPDEIIDIAYALPAQYERNAKWYFNKTSERDIRKLKDSTSDYLWPVRNQVGSLGVVPGDILGFPIVRDEFLPDLAVTASADTFPILFGDLRGYMIVDRVGLSLQRVNEPYVEQNFTVLLGRKRVGGKVVAPWMMRAYKSLNST